jgi:hypothetical protein
MLSLALTFIVAAASVVPAFAAQRSFVSTSGVDNATCSLAAPCRSFAAAITTTDVGGEVIALESGGYGPATITKSISLIAAPGIFAGISVFIDSGITVNAPGATVEVRGLSINGLGGTRGVDAQQAGKLTVDHCVIANLDHGIYVNGPIDVRILDSMIRENATTGILLAAGAAVTVNRSTILGSGVGIHVLGYTGSTYTAVYINETVLSRNNTGVRVEAGLSARARAFVTSAMIVGNAGAGVYVQGDSGTTASASAAVSNSTVAGPSGVGLWASSPSANLVISNNTVTRNTIGLLQEGLADFLSLGNNAIYANGTQDVSGNIPGISLR